jgi:hypothetical protein
MRQLTAILFLIFAASHIYAQHTDVKEWGLKGKVKLITRYMYDQGVVKLSEKWQPTDSTHYSSKSVYYFNKKGFIDSSVEAYFYSSYQQIQRIKTVYFYNKGKRISGLSYDQDGTISDISYEWLNNTTYVARSKNSHFTTKNTAWLKKDFRDSTSEIEVWEHEHGSGYNLIYKRKYVVTTGANNLILQSHNIESHSPGMDKVDDYIIHYLHQEFDSHKNPINVAELRGETLYHLVFRKIEYY